MKAHATAHLREMNVLEAERTLELNWAQSVLGKRVDLRDAGDDVKDGVGSATAGSKCCKAWGRLADRHGTDDYTAMPRDRQMLAINPCAAKARSIKRSSSRSTTYANQDE